MTTRSFLATDCGSTTTKAILVEERAGVFRLVARGEAPTTVEAPFEDVTLGVRNAVREIEELTGRQLLAEEGVATPGRDGRGVDAYVSTSSAGGGLQMLVAGVVRSLTAASAEKAALGAGAIVMDVLAADDGLRPHERIARVRQLRPDMILLAGGVDGGTVIHVVELAEQIAAAQPRPRLGRGFRLPVIYAGNREARAEVARVLAEWVDLRCVANVRPAMEREDLGPARRAIHEVFMEHVMAQAPGYDRLRRWVGAPVLPTPAAVGLEMENVARARGCSVLGVDIGGATTDVFSVFRGVFHRTVSANLGMSYSARHVLLEAGVDNVRRWLPFPADPEVLRGRIANKMIRPTSIPQTIEDLLVEHALAREALRLAFAHHVSLAVGLGGVGRDREAGGFFAAGARPRSLVDVMALGLLIGSGGVLSHAPRRAQAALMLLDAFQPAGVTELAVDSIFMLPQLGAISQVSPRAAADVFERDCLVRLGTVVAPTGRHWRAGQPVLRLRLGGRQEVLRAGELRRLPLGAETSVRAELLPERAVDVGRGPGVRATVALSGGAVGLILDGRGRPLELPRGEEERVRCVLAWLRALDAYPPQALAALARRAPGPSEGTGSASALTGEWQGGAPGATGPQGPDAAPPAPGPAVPPHAPPRRKRPGQKLGLCPPRLPRSGGSGGAVKAAGD